MPEEDRTITAAEVRELADAIEASPNITRDIVWAIVQHWTVECPDSDPIRRWRKMPISLQRALIKGLGDHRARWAASFTGDELKRIGFVEERR